jgi:hypothetical protein
LCLEVVKSTGVNGCSRYKQPHTWKNRKIEIGPTSLSPLCRFLQVSSAVTTSKQAFYQLEQETIKPYSQQHETIHFRAADIDPVGPQWKTSDGS